MGVKLYVGNLPFNTTDKNFNNHFSANGNVVSAKVIMDRYTGRSRGFGFVEMASPDEAQAAITALHETDMSGRILVVNEARPQEERRPFAKRPNNPQ